MVGLLRVSRRIVGMTVNDILAPFESLGDDARRAHNTKAGAPAKAATVKYDRDLAKGAHAALLKLDRDDRERDG